jgi:SAM-dependent methyltransferase
MSSSSLPRIDSVSESGAALTPSAERNAGPLLTEISRFLPKRARVLEFACGTGQHAAYLCRELPSIDHFQPTDATDALFSSVVAHGNAALLEGRERLAAPRLFDVINEGSWIPEAASYDAVLVVNLLHIAPIAATPGAISAAGRALREGGHFFVYGPFLVDGLPTTPSNAEFDASLRARDAGWGLRDVSTVVECAQSKALALVQRVDMPANNFLLVFVKIR